MFLKLIKCIRTPVIAFAAAGPIDTVIPHDVIDPQIKTAKSFQRFKDNETGVDRIKQMFQLE
jgi:hypothetical protein